MKLISGLGRALSELRTGLRNRHPPVRVLVTKMIGSLAVAGRAALQIGVVAEAFIDRPLLELVEWLRRAAPDITQIEIGSGGYAPRAHCDTPLLLKDADARRRWHAAIRERGLEISALNAWGNPLHPDATIAMQHDRDLRDSIRLAAELDVNRVVALAGCPGGGAMDRATPHFAGGGWLPYLEGVWERQWQDHVGPYWSDVAEFARAEHPTLRVCLELHPGTAIYNVESFEHLAALGDNLAANLDPSHFFWQSMDALAIVRRLGPRIGYTHAKDVRFIPENLALNGIMDYRWPRPPERMPWNFATVGRGQGRDAGWWRVFVSAVADHTAAHTLSIEHEDPFVSPSEGVPEAAGLLAEATATLASGRSHV